MIAVGAGESCRAVADALAISRRSRATAMLAIVAGLVLSGAAVLVAAFGYLTPIVGALLHQAIDVAVILDALRALRSGKRA